MPSSKGVNLEAVRTINAVRQAMPRFDERPEVIHGVNCRKAPHVIDGVNCGYLHAEDDDRPYDVDGMEYCGRCHCFMEIMGRK